VGEELEEWRDVVGEEGRYQVSSLGRVRSLPHIAVVAMHGTTHSRRYPGKTLRPWNVRGYCWVSFWDKGKASHLKRAVHVLVLEAFISPRPIVMYDACHNDGDPSNNVVTNLRWDTRVENGRDSVRHGTNIWSKRTHCINGHEYLPGSYYEGPNYLGRICKACARANAARSKMKKKMESLDNVH